MGGISFVRRGVAQGGRSGRVIGWLIRRPRTCTLLAVLYLAAVIISHDWMQQPAYWAQGQLSHERWNNLVTAVSVPLLAAFVAWTAVAVWRHERRAWVAAYLLTIVTLAAIAFRTLLVMNIEIVHFPQYAILAVLIFALARRYVATLIWCTLAGLLDEGYQYFYLYANRGIHFDFNDVVLNWIGAAFGLVLVLAGTSDGDRRTVRAERRQKLDAPPVSRDSTPTRALRNSQLPRSLWNRPWGWLRWRSVWVAGGVLAIGAALTAVGRLRLLADPDGLSAIVLRRGGPASSFWTHTTWGKTYHEIHPFEFLVLVSALTLLFVPLDLLARPAPAADEDSPQAAIAVASLPVH